MKLSIIGGTGPQGKGLALRFAKVGFEVTKSIFESSKSIVWRQAYNRLIAQKKLLQFINWN